MAERPLRYVGVAHDLRSPYPALQEADLELARQAGFNTVKLITTWSPSQAEAINDVPILKAAVTAAKRRGLEVIVTFAPCWQRDFCHPPLSVSDQRRFVTTLGYLARTLDVRLWEIGNEPNSSTFWWPQFSFRGESVAPKSYARLVGLAYDELKKVSAENKLICGALTSGGFDNPGRPKESHSVERFIAEMGAAYRQSGRNAPLCDIFSLHPYGENPEEPPTVVHGSLVGFADHLRLVAALRLAFRGTAQSLPPVLYSEYGVDAQVPPGKRNLYSGVPAVRVAENRQADFYRQAFLLAACQPGTIGVILFMIRDEPQLERWQSGLYYPDGSAKSSLPSVRQAMLDASSGNVACE